MITRLLWTVFLVALLCACEAQERSVDRAQADGITIDQLFDAGRSDQMVAGRGEVVKVLRDDTKGSRHQRFIVRLRSGVTVLIAHNIDLAPRLADLRRGDRISFYGEYEWNDKGGVIHWTHHAPRGDHEAGWIDHAGKRYQ